MNKKITNGTELGIYIGDELIGTTRESCSLPMFDENVFRSGIEWSIDAECFQPMEEYLSELKDIDTSNYEYYMRRGDKYYFRNDSNKMTVESSDSLPIRYGDIITLNIDSNE